MSLTSDQDRDRFIDTFWAIRNPDPTAPGNTFREEHYRRLDYANTHYGSAFKPNGWRTDRGMVYITLGPPAQKSTYTNTKYLLPMEIWFYQDPGSALAPYFSVLFFQRSPAEDYRIYSPYQDRPEKLIASTNAVNDEPAALKIIKEDLGNEVANLTLSLFPNEPVDNVQGTPTLESDALLNKIRNYRNLPENTDLLARTTGSAGGRDPPRSAGAGLQRSLCVGHPRWRQSGQHPLPPSLVKPRRFRAWERCHQRGSITPCRWKRSCSPQTAR